MVLLYIKPGPCPSTSVILGTSAAHNALHTTPNAKVYIMTNNAIPFPTAASVAAAQAKLPKNGALRAIRIAAVHAALRAKRTAHKLHLHVCATNAYKQQAYLAAVQQLAVSYGLDPAQNTVAVRSVHAKQNHAPSAQAGACARVHALCELHNGVRANVLAACKQEGINPATAATQYQRWKRANTVAA